MSESSKPVTEPADADGEATRIYVPDSPGGPAPGQFPGYPTSSSKGLTPGQVLGYTYRIERLLARGGMGAVYRARHVDLGSVHAIKVILPELAEDPRTISLFQEEANKLRRLRHDAIVSYEGLFRDEGGARYLVMEFVDGPSLAHVLKSGPLPLSELRQLRDRCAAGLAAAHAKGIIHRDISPDNIILVDGRADLAKIIDFGIAKSTNPGDLTILGQEFAGKYAYVSPEQLGMIESPVDARSDIYSLGLVLAAAAIGRPLDIGGGYLRAIEARRRPLDLTGVPDAFRAEIAAMVDPDPTRRPASLQGYEAAERDGATIAPVAIPVRSAPRGSNLLAIFGAVTLFSLLGVGGAWLYRQVPHAEHDEVPTTASTPPTTAQPVPLPAARDASLGLPPPLPHQAESALAPGQSLRDCPDCPELIIVPAGEFQMGDPSLPVASPVRQIRIPTPLAIGKFPILRGEYARFAGELASDRSWRTPGFDQSDRDPAVKINWNDAQLYVHWLNLKTGKSYRLLRSAEWEWAARAGGTTAYSWGDDLPHGNADCDGCGSVWDGRRTAPAASFPPNGFGLYDMSGNVWQWVQDCWTPNYAALPADGSPPPSPGICAEHALRGGAWNSRPAALRTANRIDRPATDRSSDAGFRIVRALGP
jgi:formylglycine-generating enzyme required for sulfatase activity